MLREGDGRRDGRQVRQGVPVTDATTPVLELGTGFQDDEVTVLLDGREVWHGRGVTTDYSVGLADVVRLPGMPAPTEIEVRVRDLADRAPVPEPAAHEDEVRFAARLDPAHTTLAVDRASEEPRF